MAKFRKVKVFNVEIAHKYTMPSYDIVNDFLRFIGTRVLSVQLVAHAKAGQFCFAILYKSSDAFEIQVEQFLNP